MKTLIILFLLPLQVLSQDITGIWTGTIRTTGNDLPFEIVISETSGKLSGYSLMIFTMNGIDNMGIKSIKLKNKNGNISIEDDELIYNNYSTPPRRIKLIGELSLAVKDSLTTLSGVFKTRSIDFRYQDNNPYSGTIELMKQNILTKTKLISMLDQLKLLNTLSFLQPKTSGKETPVIAGISKEEIQPSLPKRKEIILTPAIIKESTLVYANEQMNNAPVIFISPVINEDTLHTLISDNIEPSLPKRKDIVLTPVIIKKTPNIPEPEQMNIAAMTSFLFPVKKTKTIVDDNIIAASVIRKTEVIKSFFIKSDSLVLSLYDNGIVDGDSVSLVLNGKVIIANQGLTTQPIRLVIHISPDLGDSLLLTMVADNLGTIPPNTGLLVVQNGNERDEIFFTGDMQMSSAVLFRKKH